MKKLFTLSLIVLSFSCMAQNITLTRQQFQKSLDSCIAVAMNKTIAQLVPVPMKQTTLDSLSKINVIEKALKDADSTIKNDASLLLKKVNDLNKRIDDFEAWKKLLDEWKQTAAADIKKAIDTGNSNTQSLTEVKTWQEKKQAVFIQLSNQ